MQGMIGIERDTAAHTAGIVAENSAHHGSGNGRRIGPDFFTIGREQFIHHGAGDTGLHGDETTIGTHDSIPPVLTQIHKDTIGDGLSAQARTTRSKGHGYAQFLRDLKYASDLTFGDGLHDDSRSKVIETSIGGIGDPVDQARFNAIGGEELGKVRKQGIHERAN